MSNNKLHAKKDLISRRVFVRLMGGVPVAFTALPSIAFSAAEREAGGVLVTTESFRDHGGWVLDTQFYEQMGGNYLLAHGFGTPVENAKTTLHFPKPGTYQLWVRTNNWCPGDWAPPGRFEILINGAALPMQFGKARKGGWNWQSGGVVNVAKETRIELRDLTGFEGRCEALYFSPRKNFIPPNEADKWRAWRDLKLGVNQENPETKSFDVIIVGGGIAGCAAALAAASQRLSVALLQDRPVFGGNASSEVRVHTIGITGKGDAILSKINTPVWDGLNGDDDSIKDESKRHKALNAVANIHQFKSHRACALDLENGRIASVTARESRSGVYRRFKAPVFVDCTGDAWIGYWAGAEYRYGRESRSEFGEEWKKYGNLWSPEKPDNRVMGSSVLWNTSTAEEPVSFPDVPWAKDVAKSHKATRGKWFWEYGSNDLHQIYDAEKIRDHVLRAIYGSFANAKRDPLNARLKLEWVAYIAGKRESRRLMGDHIFTMQDAAQSRDFADAVVEEIREIDVHFQKKIKGHPLDFLSEALFYKTDRYYIPFRSLYSKNVDNLMMAGRCFSCSHVGLGGPRIQNTTGQMGIATGYAAALCKKYGVDPRGVYKHHITELRRLIGYEQKA